MFKVYILDKETEIPTEGTFYVVAKDGIYLRKDTGLIQAMVKVGGIGCLQEVKTKVNLQMAKIPAHILVRSLMFFRAIYREHKSEAAVLLYYSAEKKKYWIDVPNQLVTFGSVDYKIDHKKTPEGYQLVGTIHSHCSFGAFHSGTDKSDERHFDGVHITLGKVNLPYFTVSSSVVVNDNRFKVKIQDLAEGVYGVDYQPKSEKIENYVRNLGIFRALDQLLDPYSWEDEDDEVVGVADNAANHPWAPTRAPVIRKVEKVQYYDIILPDGKDYRSFPVLQSWMNRVSKAVTTYSQRNPDDGFYRIPDEFRSAYRKEEKKCASK